MISNVSEQRERAYHGTDTLTERERGLHGDVDSDQRISSDEKAKIRLQIVCYNEMMTTFHFCNLIGVDAQRRDRDGVSDLLRVLLPEFKTMIDQALEMKTRYAHQLTSDR